MTNDELDRDEALARGLSGTEASGYGAKIITLITEIRRLRRQLDIWQGKFDMKPFSDQDIEDIRTEFTR